MTKQRIVARSSTLLNVGASLIFIVVAATVIVLVNHTMRQQALAEAEAKAHILLDRNLATHSYFSQILKPNLFEWTAPFRTDEYFDPSWMSSTFAIREIDHYFQEFSQTSYYVKDAAINARSPENEADAYERAFLEELRTKPDLGARSTVRSIKGQPYFVVLRPGEVLEESCLRCHSDPADAPRGLVDYYGQERGLHREGDLGHVVSAISIRVPLAEAYGQANHFSLQLSAVLLLLLAGLFVAHLYLQRRLVFAPLDTIRAKAHDIATAPEHLGEEIPIPLASDLAGLARTFNIMSINLRHSRDQLEQRVATRTADLATANEQLELEIAERQRAEEALKDYSERLEELVEERIRELQETQEQLIRQEKLAVLGQLAGGVGHELRNPLGTIKNAVYFLNMVVEERDPDVQEMFEILEQEVNRSERIIDDLLNFARERPPLRLAVDLNEVVRTALSRVQIPENVEVASQLAEDLPPILADPGLLDQVFGNLIHNAIQAMPDGGCLIIQSEVQSPGEVTVSVSDTGVGIPAENRAKIFEPLFTTRARGIGLGLALVKMLVERQGGEIEVQSEPGAGSTFTVHLPAHVEKDDT